MKKNITIIAVSVAVIIGFGYYTLFSSPAGKTAEKLAEEQEKLSVENEIVKVEEVGPRQGVDTLNNLRLLNEDLECTIVSLPKEGESKTEGTYFVSKGIMRGDFLTDSPDLSGQVLTSMIIDNGTIYIWSEIEGESYGMKMSLSEVDSGATGANEPLSINDQISYDCKPWRNVDNTVFVPPSDVLFRDLSQLMQGGMEYGTVYEEGELPF